MKRRARRRELESRVPAPRREAARPGPRPRERLLVIERLAFKIAQIESHAEISELCARVGISESQLYNVLDGRRAIDAAARAKVHQLLLRRSHQQPC
jgi:hypothetical protein